MPSALWFCNPVCFASDYLIKAKCFVLFSFTIAMIKSLDKWNLKGTGVHPGSKFKCIVCHLGGFKARGA